MLTPLIVSGSSKNLSNSWPNVTTNAPTIEPVIEPIPPSTTINNISYVSVVENIL